MVDEDILGFHKDRVVGQVLGFGAVVNQGVIGDGKLHVRVNQVRLGVGSTLEAIALTNSDGHHPDGVVQVFVDEIGDVDVHRVGSVKHRTQSRMDDTVNEQRKPGDKRHDIEP